MSEQAPVASSPTRLLSVILWLVSTAVVAVVGTILLENSQIGWPLTQAYWSLALLAAEVILYLLILTVGSTDRIGAWRAFMGTLLGLTVRAGINVINVQAIAPTQASSGSFLSTFSYFYLLYWPGVLVQLCAVAIFLWVLREIWMESSPAALSRPHPPAADSQSWEDHLQRQQELLAALMEGNGEEESKSVAEEPDLGAGFYEHIDSSASLTLPLTETDDQPPEEIADVPSAKEEQPDDTSLIPVGTEEPEPAPKQSEPVEQAEQSALPIQAEVLAEQALAGSAVSGITPFAGGVLVWGAQTDLEDAELAEAVGPLLVAASALASEARAGAVQILLIEGEQGCWALVADSEREGWWLGLAQPAPVKPGITLLSARRALASLADAEIAEEVSFDNVPSLQSIEYLQEAVSHRLADPLLKQWGLTMTLGKVGDQRVLVAAPSGRDQAGLASDILPLWSSAQQLMAVAGWPEVQTVLIGAKESVVAVGEASWAGQPALLTVVGCDMTRVASGRLLLGKLADKLHDYGPQYRPGLNVDAGQSP